MKSRFEGNVLGFIGGNILAAIIIFFTIGIETPWSMCIKYRWEVDNTTIDGKRLRFVGSGTDLFVHYIKWWILTIITFGIYGFWLYINLIKWRVENIEFIN